MKIKKLSVKYHPTGLEIQNVEFDDTLSLLVGISGVGKTSILEAIHDLKKVALFGISINGFEWDIQFEVGNKQYNWNGKFEVILQQSALANLIGFETNQINTEYKIKYENLSANEVGIITRNESDIYFNNYKTVKLESTKSAIYLLKEEDQIANILKSFEDIFSISEIQNANVLSLVNYDNLNDELDLNLLREFYGSIVEKMYICQIKLPDIYMDFKSVYKEIFPYVKDLGIFRKKIGGEESYNLTELTIKIKEYGVDHWVDQNFISSGMMKTLIHLAYIYFSPKGAIFLIDEFENGFGVNCINSISDYVLNSGSDYQFIMTSHHPYIINNIPVEKWKIVNRRKNIVTAESAAKHIDASNHDAFIKLINSNFYTQGVEVNSNNNDLTEDDLYS